MDQRDVLLRAYDEQLRTQAEMANALTTHRIGPLWLATYSGGSGFISYRDLAGLPSDHLDQLVTDALAYFTAVDAIADVEWKTRSHDHAPGLHEILLRHGFAPQEPESIMLGDARLLAVDVPLPPGVIVRQVENDTEIRAMCAMQDRVFGGTTADDRVEELVRRHGSDDQLELWIAAANGEIVSAGRLELVPNTDFAGLWGGATLESWRGQGIYRALTAARARSALAQGKIYLHSDSTEFSRPILERSGMIKVSTTTPYLWQR
ncbi:MAG: GNAT family N-acetyltransferase [Thermomicrobiales bacterium]|nr:GNAT family N-acetyltransferase [Thermomicrobiales bacterium]